MILLPARADSEPIIKFGLHKVQAGKCQKMRIIVNSPESFGLRYIAVLKSKFDARHFGVSALDTIHTKSTVFVDYLSIGKRTEQLVNDQSQIDVMQLTTIINYQISDCIYI